MGLRVRKSIKIAPGVKVNVGKKSVGVSVGNKYGGVSVNSKKGVTTRVSAPGTGISHTQHVSTTKAKSTQQRNSQNKQPSPIALRMGGLLFLIMGIVLIAFGATIGEAVGSGWFLYIFGSICLLLGIFYLISSKKSK